MVQIMWMWLGSHSLISRRAGSTKSSLHSFVFFGLHTNFVLDCEDPVNLRATVCFISGLAETQSILLGQLPFYSRFIHILVFMWWFHLDTSSLLLPHLRCLFLWLCVYWLLQRVPSATCSLSRFCDPACPMPLLSLSSLHLYFFHCSQLSSRKSLSLAPPKPRYPPFRNKFSTAAWVLCVTRLPRVTCHPSPSPRLDITHLWD